tara:strand:- start:419 stop:718 length:300 start_codon:yes stop_codon:yes gene_type:complete
MSKWNRWKLIHKETGKTFKQLVRAGEFKHYKSSAELIPVLLVTGVPAYYNTDKYYPYMEILDARDWKIIMKPASPEGVDKREKALDELTKQAQDLDMGY